MYTFKFFTTLSCAILLSSAFSWGQVTENPKVEERSVQYVQITKVELTSQYTKIYLRYQSPRSSRSPFPPGIGQSGGQIWIDPETRLYKPGDVTTKFRFIKAEGIPTNPEKLRVQGDESIDFVTYFERLTPGIEIFDFYEGRGGKEGQTWNFYGIHIKNPLRKSTPGAKANPAPVEEKTEPEATATEPVPSSQEAENTLTTLKGTVYNAKTKQPVQASISYVDQGDSLHLTTSSSGNYRIALSNGPSHQFTVQAKGYITLATSVNGPEPDGTAPAIQDFYLTPLAAGESFRLDNIYFETSQFTLLPESFPELDRLVETLTQNPSLQIRVEGHTDSAGDFDKNLLLSKNRALSVKDYLVKKGIDESRIEIQGYGATRPASQGKSELEKQKNRRVEIVITRT